MLCDRRSRFSLGRLFLTRRGLLSPRQLARPVEAVKNTRKLTKNDMVHNNWQPKIEVDAETYGVRADGELLECEPAQTLPLAQRYFLF